MRVLFAHSGNIYGGVERVLDTVADGARRWSAFDPVFALCFDGRPAESLRKHGADVRVVGEVRITRPQLLVRARRRFADVLRDVRPDVVIATSTWAHTVFAPVVRSEGVALVLWVHDALSGRPWIERLARRHHPDLLIANSHYTLASARKVFAGVDAQTIYCPLTFGEPAASRAHVRRDLDTRDDSVVIVNVARMEPYKGQAVLIDALSRLKTTSPWTCWIVGGAQRPQDVRYRQSLGERAAALGLTDRVQFLGQRDDVASLLAAADVYCHPNRTAEPFGLSIIEALHAGLPVVSSALGGPEEIVTPACGRLVAAGSEGALAEALETLIADSAARQTLAKAGPARAAALCDARARLADMSAALSQVRTGVAA